MERSEMTQREIMTWEEKPRDKTLNIISHSNWKLGKTGYEWITNTKGLKTQGGISSGLFQQMPGYFKNNFE